MGDIPMGRDSPCMSSQCHVRLRVACRLDRYRRDPRAADCAPLVSLRACHSGQRAACVLGYVVCGSQRAAAAGRRALVQRCTCNRVACRLMAVRSHGAQGVFGVP